MWNESETKQSWELTTMRLAGLVHQRLKTVGPQESAPNDSERAEAPRNAAESNSCGRCASALLRPVEFVELACRAVGVSHRDGQRCSERESDHCE